MAVNGKCFMENLPNRLKTKKYSSIYIVFVANPVTNPDRMDNQNHFLFVNSIFTLILSDNK
jgi:hypothetical protein